MPFYQHYINTIQRYFDFEGRTGRQEYWLTVLVHVAIAITLRVIDGIIFGWEVDDGVISGLYGLVVLLPMLGLGARRLHDIGRSGWWQLLFFAVIAGWIVLVIFWITPSDPDENAHGMPPISPDDMDPGMDPGAGMMQQ